MPISLNPRTFEREMITSTDRPTVDLLLPPRELEEQAWHALQAANSPPDLFVDSQTREPVRILETESGPFLQRLSRDAWRRELVRRIRWEKGVRGEEAFPPEKLVQNMLSRRDAPLPVLRRVAHFPFYSASGNLVFFRGYDEPSRIYLAEDFTAVRKLACELSRRLAEQRLKIIREPFADFVFEDSASPANLVALMVSVLIREMIPGAVPLFCVNKPCPGLGGTLLIQTAGTIITGGSLPAITPPDRRDGAELRRLLTSALRDQPAFVFLDNWDDLRSTSLAAILTSKTFADREIGTSQTFYSENRSLIVAVGNNIQLGPEIARRTVPIQLGLAGPDPLKRRDYRIPNLLEWTRSHRGRLLAALLAMIEAWRAAGCPKSTKRLPSFEAWSSLIGGILEANGVASFLENVDLSCLRSDPRWVSFCQAWSREFGTSPALASDLLPLARQAGIVAKGETAVSLGRQLSARVGSVFDGFLIERAGRSDNSALYQLVCHSHAESRCTPADEVTPAAAKFLQ